MVVLYLMVLARLCIVVYLSLELVDNWELQWVPENLVPWVERQVRQSWDLSH